MLFGSFASLSFAGTTIDPSRSVYLGRNIGMGGAHLGLSDDGEGLFVNPSGLAGIQFPQISGVSRKIFLDETAYSIYSFAAPSEWGTFGVGFVDANTGGSYATSRDNSGRININPSLEAMSYDNNVMLFTYARMLPTFSNLPVKLTGPLSVGGNLKLFNQSISGGGVGNRGTAFNLDLSATYKPMRWLTVAGTLQNLLGGSIQWNNSSDKLGGYYKFGAAMNVLGSSAEAFMKSDHKVTAAFDLDLPHDVLGSNMLMHIGAEYMPVSFVALRAGINQEPSGAGLTLGIGLIQQAFRFDYAYAQRPGITGGDTPHFFSLSYIGARVVDVTKKMKKKENAIRFLHPKDRFITSAETVALKVDAKYANVLDQKTTWTVPLFSATSEVRETREYHNLVNNYIDMQNTTKIGTVEITSRPMTNYGRYIIKATGVITPEITYVSSEVKVLRFEPFKDTAMDFWAIEPIALNSVLGLINGYPDKTFRPEKGINRAELTALLVRTSYVSPETWEKAMQSSKFKDVPKKHWAHAYINVGAELGLVTGYPDGTFRPAKVLNRGEGVTVLARYAKLPEKEGSVEAFPDLKKGFWANKFIDPAKDAHLLDFLAGKTFAATREFARCEAAEVLYKTAPIQKMVNSYWDQGIFPMITTAPEPATKEATVKPAPLKKKKAVLKTSPRPSAPTPSR